MILNLDLRDRFFLGSAKVMWDFSNSLEISELPVAAINFQSQKSRNHKTTKWDMDV